MFALWKFANFSLFGHGLYPAFFAPPHSTNHIYLLFTMDTEQAFHFFPDFFSPGHFCFYSFPKPS